MTAQGTPQSQIESLQQALAAATERAEKAEARVPERAGVAAMREALEGAALLFLHRDRPIYADESIVDRLNNEDRLKGRIKESLSSTAGAEYVATMEAYRLALDRSGCACRSGNEQLGESPYKCLRCVTLESHTAGAEMLERLKELRGGAAWAYQLAGVIEMPVEALDNLSALAQGKKPPHDWPYPADCERLRKAEAERDNLADCWQKAEGALNDMEIAKNERITTLEAALVDIGMALGTHDASSPQQILEDVNSLKSRHGKLEAALEEARKALDRHGIHKQPCAQIQRRPPGEILADCTCGLAAHERIGRLMPGGKSDA